jgi:general secretion pathway protein I
MLDNKPLRTPRRRQAGVSLLEILIAVSILGIAFTATFAGFSTALRTVARLDEHQVAVALATSKLNELLLEPTLDPGSERSGVSEAGLRWRARTELAEERAGVVPERSLQLLRVAVEVEWGNAAGRRQTFHLESLKLQLAEGAGAS